ncbi:MAG: hypothetical protein ACOY3J_01680 [Bacillota bacterium]|uniref:Uncharacterized protein n=1 Tax=Thermanaerosceptrum fracticalcis TaxID=1712410 RepID=A0A7G6E5H9_THEFR|nr:hypothetical protein [Thermanaerosceptrum fracticalcis]QNB47333.1 hypothetical protein BR63_14160 [Thermanaerosceptrum fracticalcis]
MTPAEITLTTALWNIPSCTPDGDGRKNEIVPGHVHLRQVAERVKQIRVFVLV